MGIYTDIIDELVDSGYSDGTTVGWSSISPRIKYSSRENNIMSSLGINKSTTVKEISNIGNIVFLKQSDSVEQQQGKIELIIKWKYVTERRKNELLALKRHMKFEGSRMSIDTSVSELEGAYCSIIEILSASPYIMVSKSNTTSMDDDFLNLFSKELLKRLLHYLKNVDDMEISKKIILDMKYLVAVIINSQNEEEEYECSIIQYVDYLKKLGLTYVDEDCKECSIDSIFLEYKFCLICGRRRI